MDGRPVERGAADGDAPGVIWFGRPSQPTGPGSAPSDPDDVITVGLTTDRDFAPAGPSPIPIGPLYVQPPYRPGGGSGVDDDDDAIVIGAEPYRPASPPSPFEQTSYDLHTIPAPGPTPVPAPQPPPSPPASPT
ncbi:MAG: hypothetical protein IRZ08_17860, partial [Frankia sp.]|nr:hypothetical protein [Frankia sp.]